MSSVEPVPTGDADRRCEYEPTGILEILKGWGTPGQFRLFFGERLVGTLDVPYTVPGLFGVAGLSCGDDAYDSVNPEDYEAPFPFTGHIDHVTLDLSGDLTVIPEVEFQRLMSQP